eukprot:116769_1
MPVMNHQDTVVSRDISDTNAIHINPTHTLQIGEEDHAQHIGESHPTDHDVVAPSIDDRYLPLILAHIGSIDSFNALYSRHDEEVIGVGADTVVYKCTTRQNGEEVAVKQTVLSSKAQLVHWFAKYLMIKQCDFYSQYDAFIMDSNPKQARFTVLLVQELLHDNLTEILTDIQSDNMLNKAKSSQTMDEHEVQTITHQIVSQLAALRQNHNHVHCDIKPTNIMRRKDGSYTLIDFGFAMECNSSYSGYLGTKFWSAPEMKPHEDSTNTIDESIDMWSIGLVIIYCLFNGHHPFAYKRRKKVRSKQCLQHITKWYNRKVKDKQCFIESWLGKQLMTNKISYNLFDFLFKCLRFDPNKRLTPTEALDHKWLHR